MKPILAMQPLPYPDFLISSYSHILVVLAKMIVLVMMDMVVLVTIMVLGTMVVSVALVKMVLLQTTRAISDVEC